MNNYISLSSLSMDLRRAALGYWRGSDKMAKRFWDEALLRRREIDRPKLAPYIVKLLDGLEGILKTKDKQKAAEDILLYSILFQNASLKLK